MAHNLFAARYRRERESARDDLAERAHVGLHAVEFLRAAIREAKAGNDFVEYERNAVLRRYLSDALKETGLGRQQALERLYYDRAEFVVMPLDDVGGCLKVVEGRD